MSVCGLKSSFIAAGWYFEYNSFLLLKTNLSASTLYKFLTGTTSANLKILFVFLPCESLTYLHYPFSGWSVWNSTHSDLDIKKIQKVWGLKITLLWPWLMYFFCKCDMSYLGVIQQLWTKFYPHLTTYNPRVDSCEDFIYYLPCFQVTKHEHPTDYLWPLFVHIIFEWLLGR